MLGKKNGLVARVRSDLNKPYIVAVHCSAHRLELAWKDSMKKKKLLNKLSVLLDNLYYFYRNSPLNRSNLKQAFKSVGQAPLLPTRTGGTRWVGHLNRALCQVSRGYDAYRLHLEQLSSKDAPSSLRGRADPSAKATNFLRLLTSKSMYKLIFFMLDVTNALGAVSNKMQERDVVIGDVKEEIDCALENLENLKTRDGLCVRKVDAEKLDQMSGTLASFESSRKALLEDLQQCLSKRFEDDNQFIEASKIANLKYWPLDLHEDSAFGNDAVDLLLDKFSEALGEDTCNDISAQWTKFKRDVYARNPKVPVPSLSWKQVFSQLLSTHGKGVLRLIELLLSLPASSAEAERGFNHLKIVKSDWRTRLTDTALSSQLCILMNSNPVESYDPEPAFLIWNKTGQRGKNLAGATKKVRPAETVDDQNVRTETEEMTEREEVTERDEERHNEEGQARTEEDIESEDEDYFSDCDVDFEAEESSYHELENALDD